MHREESMTTLELGLGLGLELGLRQTTRVRDFSRFSPLPRLYGSLDSITR